MAAAIHEQCAILAMARLLASVKYAKENARFAMLAAGMFAEPKVYNAKVGGMMDPRK